MGEPPSDEALLAVFDVPSGDAGSDWCCGCDPESADCCIRSCFSPECSEDFCCFKPGLTGTVIFTQHTREYEHCCSQCFCDDPGIPPGEPCCIVTTCPGITRTWEMVQITCFHSIIFVPFAGADVQCGYPFEWLNSGWRNLAPDCGCCIPCGPPDHCVIDCQSPCECFTPTPAGCCGDLQHDGPGLDCPSEINEHFFSCEMFVTRCFHNRSKCVGEDPCVPDCDENALMSTLTFDLHTPHPCELCLESIDGGPRCYTPGAEFNDFCMDP